jgi:hypothetical protein
MATEGRYDNDPFVDLVTELAQKLTVRGWDGPHYTPPDAPLSHGDWEISMGKRDEPNSRGNPWMIVNVWARKRYTIKEAKSVTVEKMARDLAIAVAGRAAHEALEWCWFEDETFVDPHNKDVIAGAASEIRDRLVNQRNDD